MLNADEAATLVIPTRRGRGSHISMWLDPTSRLRLQLTRDRAAEHLNVKASNSVFVRAALKLLEARLMDAIADPASPAAQWLVTELQVAGEAGGSGG